MRRIAHALVEEGVYFVCDPGDEFSTPSIVVKEWDSDVLGRLAKEGDVE
jgi:hypothetical protein